MTLIGGLAGNGHNGEEKASGAFGGGDEGGEPAKLEHRAPGRHKADLRGPHQGRQY